MFEFKVNKNRNAVLCVLKGQFDAEEARNYTDRFKQACDQLQPGFTIISDLRDYAPALEDAREILEEGIQYAIDKQRGRAFRIVNESIGSKVGNVQLNQSARQIGYQVEIVNSMDQVNKAMGWD